MIQFYEAQSEIEKPLDKNNYLTAAAKRKGSHF
jgi:hypothetical protein